MKYLLFLVSIAFLGCSLEKFSFDDDNLNGNDNDVFDDIENIDSDNEDSDLNDEDASDQIEFTVDLAEWKRVSGGFQFYNYNNRSTVFLNGKYYLVSMDKVFLSSDAVNWQTINMNAPFKSRTRHSAVKFKDKIVVIGDDFYSSTGDVWYSEDGMSWDVACRKCPFGTRADPSVIEFKDKLWIIGGILKYSIYPTDIWSSSDMINWEQVVEQAPFGEFISQELILHNNKLWLLGMNKDETKTSLWSSPDGINWDCISDALPFEVRKKPGFFSWKGKIWVAGGFHYGDVVYKNDVWSSEDGLNWTKTGDFGEFAGRAGFSAVVKEDEILLVGGYGEKTGSLQEVIYSEDGKKWKLKWRSQSLPGRFGHTVTLFKDKFWLIGGRVRYSEDNIVQNSIYSSLDGTKWDLVSDEAPFGFRMDHAAVVFKDKIWVLGGNYYSEDSFQGDVWSSGNGVDWKKEVDTAPFDGSTVQEAYVHNDEITVVANEKNSYGEYFWHSPDGKNWRKGVSKYFIKCNNSKIVVHEGTPYLIGGCNAKYCGNEVFRKEESGDWVKLETENIFTPRCKHGLVSSGGYLWVIGGSDGDDLNDVWYSKNGKRWFQAEDGGFEPRAYFASSSHNSKLWVFGGFEYNQNMSVFGDVWVSQIETEDIKETAADTETENKEFSDVEWSFAGRNVVPGRYDHAFLKTHDGFYIIGGVETQEMIEIVNSVIFSENGMEWSTQSSNSTAMNKKGVAYVYFKKKIWGIGGKSEDYSHYQSVINEIIVSNGKQWDIAVENPQLVPRYNHKAVVFKDKIWVVGGFDSDGNGLNDVWSSEDGINWKREVAHAEFRGRGSHGLYVFKEKIFMIGGLRNYWDDGVSEVWSSEDGIRWERDSYAPFSQRSMSASAVASGALWVFGGKDKSGYLNDLYYSFDGRNWKKAECSYPVKPKVGSVMLGDGTRLWLSGGYEQQSSISLEQLFYTDLVIKDW